MSTAATAHLNAELSHRAGEIRETLVNIESLCAGLTNAQFNWRPEPGRWSIAQCVAHLNTVDGLDLDPMAAAIEHGRKHNLTGPGPYRYPWLNRYFIRQMEPPVKTKFKAPKAYVPPAEADLNTTLSTYRRNASTILNLITLANGLDLARVKTPMPALRWIKMPLGARLQLLAAHDRRHLAQARAVRSHPNFPAL